MKRFILKLPLFLPTTIVVAAIFYLTLVPKPLPDNDMMLIPGMDKIVHAIMFGGLTLTAGVDMARRSHELTPVASRGLVSIVIIVALFGGAIEIAQDAMNLGRGGDLLDWLADMAGAVVFALAVNPLIRFIDRH